MANRANANRPNKLRKTSLELSRQFPWVKRESIYRTRARQMGRKTIRGPISKHLMDLQDIEINKGKIL